MGNYHAETGLCFQRPVLLYFLTVPGGGGGMVGWGKGWHGSRDRPGLMLMLMSDVADPARTVWCIWVTIVLEILEINYASKVFLLDRGGV